MRRCQDGCSDTRCDDPKATTDSERWSPASRTADLGRRRRPSRKRKRGRRVVFRVFFFIVSPVGHTTYLGLHRLIWAEPNYGTQALHGPGPDVFHERTTGVSCRSRAAEVGSSRTGRRATAAVVPWRQPLPCRSPSMALPHGPSLSPPSSAAAAPRPFADGWAAPRPRRRRRGQLQGRGGEGRKVDSGGGGTVAIAGDRGEGGDGRDKIERVVFVCVLTWCHGGMPHHHGELAWRICDLRCTFL